MSTATLRHSAVHHKSHAIKGIAVPWKLLYFLAAACSVVMLVFYIFQVNQLTMGAYVINKYNQQMNTLTQQNTDLQAYFAQTSFLGEVASKAGELNFQKTAQVTYVQVLTGSLAEAK